MKKLLLVILFCNFAFSTSAPDTQLQGVVNGSQGSNRLRRFEFNTSHYDPGRLEVLNDGTTAIKFVTRAPEPLKIPDSQRWYGGDF